MGGVQFSFCLTKSLAPNLISVKHKVNKGDIMPNILSTEKRIARLAMPPQRPSLSFLTVKWRGTAMSRFSIFRGIQRPGGATLGAMKKAERRNM